MQNAETVGVLTLRELSLDLSSVPCSYVNGHCVFLCISIVNSTLMA